MPSWEGTIAGAPLLRSKRAFTGTASAGANLLPSATRRPATSSVGDSTPFVGTRSTYATRVAASTSTRARSPSASVSGRETAGFAKSASARATSAGPIVGSVTSTASSTVSSVTRYASLMACFACSWSSCLPGTGSTVTTVAPWKSTAPSTTAWSTWVAIPLTAAVRAASSTATIGSTFGSRRNAMNRSIGFHVLASADRAVACASNDRPACGGATSIVRPAASTVTAATVVSTSSRCNVVVASDTDWPPMSTPSTVVPRGMSERFVATRSTYASASTPRSTRNTLVIDQAIDLEGGAGGGVEGWTSVENTRRARRGRGQDRPRTVIRTRADGFTMVREDGAHPGFRPAPQVTLWHQSRPTPTGSVANCRSGTGGRLAAALGATTPPSR